MAASKDQQLVCLDLHGKPLASLATGGLTIHDLALSTSGRFVAAGTFTSDVKVRALLLTMGLRCIVLAALPSCSAAEHTLIGLSCYSSICRAEHCCRGLHAMEAHLDPPACRCMRSPGIGQGQSARWPKAT